MSKSETGFTRRTVLSAAATGAVGLAVSGTLAGDAEAGAHPGAAFVTDVKTGCAHNHQALGHELSTLIADPAVADEVKNRAIATSVCPDCGTGIAPTGLGLAVKSWV